MKNVKAYSISKSALGEFFTFVNVKADYGKRIAYQAYNSNGKNVGFVFMTHDPRTPSYGYAELCFYEKYKGKKWYRFTSEGEKISWNFLREQIALKGKFKCFID